ncbi:MAG TPA: hypothetical protein VKT17_11440 [Acidobacteriota bacterium]|nr:hypothetical protein [Acidobacteriota bacterium]
MNRNADPALVQKIMLDFARLTGLEPARTPSKRYLWTDAFAVCNLLGLHPGRKDRSALDLALELVDRVHRTLGRHRPDDSRRGWLSGLSEDEGERHPTRGGLRIGKPLNERRPAEARNERLEWEQDGQYYHYLTKWMHALSRVSRTTRDPTHLGWAIELAKAAQAGFTRAPSAGGPKRLAWKMSIDLTYPLVPAMGQHDPLDGFVTYHELQAAAGDFAGSSLPRLTDEIAEMTEILRDTGLDLATDDPLGIGGLLFDAWRILQLEIRGGHGLRELLEHVLDSALPGLKAWSASSSQEEPAERRLAFRELGLSIGLSAAENLWQAVENEPGLSGRNVRFRRPIEALMKFLPYRDSIERFWTDGENRSSAAWVQHREINMVMLATSLAPSGFLSI